MKKKNKKIIIAGVILTAILLFCSGIYICCSNLPTEQTNVLEKLRAEGLLMPLPDEVTSISAKLVSASAKSLLVDPASHRVINPADTTFAENIRMSIDSETKYYLATSKDQEEFQEQYETYKKARESTEEPKPYNLREISGADLVKGDTLFLKTDKNLIDTTENVTIIEVTVMNSARQQK